MNHCVVNMINFIRGCEPRYEMDLLTPVKEQIRMNRRYGIKNTFLVMYDAFTQTSFSDLLKDAEDDKTEVGLWIEITRGLIERLGIKWNGRPGYDWDSHVNPGFLMAYTKEQRITIINKIMEEFKNTFGHYPQAVGSWLIDSFSMKYMELNYNVKAYVICREQCGTDGYTLWGGYYNQGFYPSVHNMLCPAQTAVNQVNVPTFRMLGFDQLYGYDQHQKSCITMEPFWEWGKNPDWVDWYMKNQTENEDLGFSYVQVGQENSFGWENYGEALEMQLKKLLKLEKEKKVTLEKLSETGINFREKYKLTPATALSAYGDYKGNDSAAVWYESKNYRMGLMSQDGNVYIRDIHLFDEMFKEQFEDGICKEDSCIYETLPVIDGYSLDKNEHHGGLYFSFKGEILSHSKTDRGMRVSVKNYENSNAVINFTESSAEISADYPYELTLNCDNDASLHLINIKDRELDFEYKNYKYCVYLATGRINEKKILPDENGKIRIAF